MTNVVTIKSNQTASVGSGTAASKLNVVVGNNDTVTAGDYVSMTAGNATDEPLVISQSISGRGSNSAWNGQ